jgi:RHS repeat-associated protein
VVTDREGKVYERYEYTPYGEVWIEWENRGVERNGTLPYRFTGKELDEETGLYYYGARYLDPRASRWLSADPAVGEYLPEAPTTEEARKRNGNLPGMGGIYNYVNLHVYHYAGNNPVKYTDPDGRWTFSLGISANITFGGGWTGSVGIAFGDSENDKGSFGFYASGGETQGTPSAGIGITGSLNLKAESVKDLNGSGEKSLGGSYAMMSVDVATDENYKPDPASGISATVGKGTPLPEGHGATTATVTASTSLSELSRKLENTRQKLIEKFVDIMVNPYDNL